MGRRGAPQPLRLSDPTGAVPGGTTTTTTTLTTLTTSPDGNNLNSASSSARAPFDSHRPSPTSNSANSPATATATATSAGVSPIDSRSPRSSPRVSPFTSRFSTRRPHTSRATSNERSHNLQSDEHTPPLPDARPEPSWQSISSAVDAQPSSGPPAPTARQPQDGAAKLQKSATEHSKKFSRAGFFHFAKSSKTSNSIPASGSSSLSVARNQNTSRGRDSTEASSQPAEATQGDYSVQPVPSHPSTSELSVSSAGDRDPNSAPPSARKNKAKPFSLLTRTKSLRDKENSSPLRHAAPPLPANADTTEPESNGSAPKTAPSNGQDRAFRDMMDSSTRNRSEDRAPSRDATSAPRETHRDREHRTLPSATRENGSSNFFSGLRSSSTKAADMISKGLFGKSNSRSGPIHHLDPVIDDEHYELKVINLPLVEQARKTRISKRLETARDKTEFWMPAFPWRAIDYLNYKGCEVEGLYRVPGSGPQIKRWQRKFDEHHDVNLFEAEDLYDINIIGSMLKAWLRELPDELFPKAAQERVSRECAGAEQVPQMLIDELSNLSPFNYYLLFAITCHLSLLLAHSDKNKMDFRNLCICFQPCMKIDAFCFKFLVCDWRNCWKGCLNEAEYIEEEYRLFDQPPPRGLADSQRPSQASTEDRTPTNANKIPNVEAEDVFHESREMPDRFRERQMSSSASSKHSFQSATDIPSKPVNSKPIKKKPLPLSTSKDSMGSNDSSISTDITIGSEQPDQRTPRDHRDNTRTTSGLRRLSPIKPLSPIGF